LLFVLLRLGDGRVCALALVNAKSQLLYEKLFTAINNRCTQLGFDLDPSVVIVDFNQASF